MTVQQCQVCGSTKVYEYRRVDADGRRLCHCLACARVQLLHRGDKPTIANQESWEGGRKETACKSGTDRDSTPRTASARVGRAPRLAKRGVN